MFKSLQCQKQSRGATCRSDKETFLETVKPMRKGCQRREGLLLCCLTLFSLPQEQLQTQSPVMWVLAEVYITLGSQATRHRSLLALVT